MSTPQLLPQFRWYNVTVMSHFVIFIIFQIRLKLREIRFNAEAFFSPSLCGSYGIYGSTRRQNGESFTVFPRRNHRIWLLLKSLVWSCVLLTTRKFESPFLHSAHTCLEPAKEWVKWRDGNSVYRALRTTRKSFCQEQLELCWSKFWLL